MASNALQQLDTRLSEVRALQALNPVPSGSLPSSQAASLGSAAVNRASVVLLCGHLEGFVEDLLGEAVQELLGTGLSQRRVSNILRYKHAAKDVQALSTTANVDSFVDQLEAFLLKNQPLVLNSVLSADDLDIEILQKDFADPKPDKIFALFGVIGISKESLVKSFGGYSLRQGIISRVNSLVSVRHEIAHGVTTSTATQQDVLGYLTAVAMFGCRLDSAISEQIKVVHSGPGVAQQGLFRMRARKT